ncbi:MAG TPA: hypothetical protein VFB38_21105 [Chthonomonadaceae bacterium]|nr:hypothetical protein [Chthonomonadaceae bacterium]
MNERTKVALLTIAVVVLLGVAGIVAFRSLKGTAEPTVSAAYQRMAPNERQQLEFDMERKRRKYGKPPILHLPEDPPGFPPPEGQAASSGSALGQGYGKPR